MNFINEKIIKLQFNSFRGFSHQLLKSVERSCGWMDWFIWLMTLIETETEKETSRHVTEGAFEWARTIFNIETHSLKHR